MSLFKVKTWRQVKIAFVICYFHYYLDSMCVDNPDLTHPITGIYAGMWNINIT